MFSMPVLIKHLWQLETVVFLHWCLIRAVLLPKQCYVSKKVAKTTLVKFLEYPH